MTGKKFQVPSSKFQLPRPGEDWASRETGLTVKIVKADADVVWWENSAVWAGTCDTQTAAFVQAMKPKMKPKTNAERLKRQGEIFNHDGKCGKIITK